MPITKNMHKQSLGLYIHIPYCIHKCGYCDFNSHPIKYDEMEAYVDALVIELNYYAKKYSPGKFVNTIFLGGGTPTTLTVSQLERILNECEKKFICRFIHIFLYPFLNRIIQFFPFRIPFFKINN